MTFAAPSLPPFDEVVSNAMSVVTEAAVEWKRIQELNDEQDSIFLKNSEGILVYANEVFLKGFSSNGSPIGRNIQAFLDETVAGVSRATDYMVLNTSSYVEFDHVGRSSDGRLYQMHSCKRSLAMLGNPGLALLGVCRRVKQVDSSDTQHRLVLVDQHLRFRGLDEVDREICRLIGHGCKVREMAKELNLTSRAIEQRKKKLLETLELKSSVELIKLLVRLQDVGYVDLGL